MLKGRRGGKGGGGGVYVSRATDIDWRDTSTGLSVAEEKRERGTILCNIYPSCLLIYLALPIPSYALATPLMTSPFYSPRCAPGIIPIYPSDSSTRLFLSSVLSISAPSFPLVARTVYAPHISAYKTAGASFCLPGDNYRRSLRRRLHPKAVIPVGVIDSRNFRRKTATRNRIDFVVASR